MKKKNEIRRTIRNKTKPDIEEEKQKKFEMKKKNEIITIEINVLTISKPPIIAMKWSRRLKSASQRETEDHKKKKQSLKGMKKNNKYAIIVKMKQIIISYITCLSLCKIIYFVFVCKIILYYFICTNYVIIYNNSLFVVIWLRLVDTDEIEFLRHIV